MLAESLLADLLLLGIKANRITRAAQATNGSEMRPMRALFLVIVDSSEN